MKYRLAIFDFDGTLADTLSWFTGILGKLSRRYNFRAVDPAEYETLRGYDVRRVLEHLGVPLWKTPFIGRTMRAMMEKDSGQISLFPGVDRLLERLDRQGLALGLVSSNSCQNIRRILGPRNAERIDFYECRVPLLNKAGRLRSVLKRSGVPREQAIYIGDEIRDLEAARRARIAFGAVSWGYNRVDALCAYRPDAVYTRLEEIAW